MDTTPGYIVCGSGPIAVLLHSSMSSKDQWKPLISLLAPTFKLIAIDLAGYGDNELPLNPSTFSTDDEVALVKKIIIKETGANEPFDLIGHSYGGAIALKLAATMAQKVKTLTLFEPVAFHLLEKDRTAHNEITAIVSLLTLALKNKDTLTATQLFIDYWSGQGTFEKLAPESQSFFIRYIHKVLLDFQALFNESLSLEDYGKLTIPVCMIKGEKSPLSSTRIFQTLEETLPDRSVHSVPGGHMSPITHFKKVNKIIELFLISHALG